jgi:dihydrofolate synthase/folylpolyglutamate synthase
MQILGDTLEKIAREKAGIFKPGVPALTIEQEAPVIAAMREAAAQVGAPFNVVGKDIDFSYRFEATPGMGRHTCVCLSTARSNYEHVNVPLPGEHQAQNCGLALAILDRLRERGFETPESKVIAGLAKTKVPGRMELAWSDPRILLDGAHNEASLGALVRSIGAHVPYDSMVMVFGCCEDKDVDGLLRKIALGADKLIFTRSKATSRAMDPRELQRRFMELSGKMTQVADTLPDALNLAARAVGRDDLICVTGSFYLVGEAKKHLADLTARRAAAGEGAQGALSPTVKRAGFGARERQSH